MSFLGNEKVLENQNSVKREVLNEDSCSRHLRSFYPDLKHACAIYVQFYWANAWNTRFYRSNVALCRIN